MNLLLQGLGLCFLQIKNKRGKRRNFSETLLDGLLACGGSLPARSPEKSMSVRELGG